jgi:Ca-activated chloride channel family protein
MSTLLQDFHFLRPLWLFALPPALVLAWWSLRQSTGSAALARVIEPPLLAALLLPQTIRGSALPLALLAAGWTLAVLGLAGPTWERLPEPVHRRGDALVIALDMSVSMQAADLAPSRLARARFKLVDLLVTRRDAYTALIAYAGDAHVVTPLSDDTGTVSAMLPALDPAIMPVPGSDPVAAVRLALELLEGAGSSDGRVLIATDALTAAQGREIAALLRERSISLAVLAVGTREGAPVALPGGGFARDAAGGIVIPRLDVDGMREAALLAGANFHEISMDDSDLTALLPAGIAANPDLRVGAERVYDQWKDRAPWLALALLPLAALGFRRGWLLLLPLCLSLPAPRAMALEWQDLWLRKDQQGAQALAAGDAARAAQLFRDPAWRGSAEFQAGNWQAAADSFAASEGTDADYNRGNALARAGKLEDALAAYDAALAAQPDMEDAKANRQLVEDLLRQQQSSPPQQQPSQDSKAGEKGQQSAGQDGKSANDPSQKPQDQQSKSDSQDGQSGEQSGSGNPASEQAQNDAKPRQSEPANTSKDDANSSRADGATQDEKGSPTDPTTGRAAPSDKTQAGKSDKADGKVAGESAGETEANQAVEQWLRQVPDDPGALLRRKFAYEAAQRAAGENR